MFFNVKTKEEISKPITIIYVGTFTPWDGAALIPNLAKEFPQVQFLMVGDGAARINIEKNATNNMTFYGSVPYNELSKYYSLADAGIVLYEYERHQTVETSSLKTLEYIASGLPVFSTNIPGQTFIQENKLGCLCEEHDAKQVFFDFIKHLEEYKKEVSKYRIQNQINLSWEKSCN